MSMKKGGRKAALRVAGRLTHRRSAPSGMMPRSRGKSSPGGEKIFAKRREITAKRERIFAKRREIYAKRAEIFTKRRGILAKRAEIFAKRKKIFTNGRAVLQSGTAVYCAGERLHVAPTSPSSENMRGAVVN
jgi:hypothetical protein